MTKTTQTKTDRAATHYGRRGSISAKAHYTEKTMTTATMKKKPPTIPKVRSLVELRSLAKSDRRYRNLAIIAAQNLGGDVKDDDLDGALRWLELNASETSEKGVVDEVNFVRDLAEKRS